MSAHDSTDDTTPAAPTPDYTHQDVLDGKEGILPGARTVDRESDDKEPSVMVVLKVMRQSTRNVWLDGTPIADLGANDEYPDDSRAVVVAYRSTLDAGLTGWRATDRAMLHERVQDEMLDTYTFPKARLTTDY